MSESNYEETQLETPQRKSNAVAIAAIVAATVVLLGCILACTVTTYAFLANAPW